MENQVDDAADGRDSWVGRCIADSYVLERRIGTGAVGTVYRAHSRSISRDFAIKLVDPDDESVAEASPKTLRERIEREIDAQAQLRNPHIVQLFDVLELPCGKLAIVMDLVKGNTLRQLVARSGPLPIERARDILRQTANGVHEAHEAGLVHRDLKPSNLMVEVLPAGDDFVRIFDFGIVCLQNDKTELDGFMGTPLFASPEQARGALVDRRSDIYSLGAVFYFMLTGRPPFDADQPYKVLLAHCQETPPRLDEAHPQRRFPEELEDLVARLLAKNREERPSSLGQVIAELDALSLSASEGFHLDEASSADSAHITRQRAATVISEAVDEEAPEESKPEGALVHQPARCMSDGPAPAAQILFPERKSRGDQKALALPVRDIHVPRKMIGCAWTATPDGRVVYATKDGQLRLIDESLGAEWTIKVGLDSPAVSLDIGRGAAYLGTLDGEVRRFIFETKSSDCIYESPYDVAIDSIAVDDAGEWLVLSNANGEVRCARLRPDEKPAWRRIRTDAARVKVDVAANGSSLAVLEGASTVRLYSTGWPHERIAEVDLDYPVHCVRLSSDGTAITAITQDWQLGSWKLPAGEMLDQLLPLDRVFSVDFTKNDELVLLRTE